MTIPCGGEAIWDISSVDWDEGGGDEGNDIEGIGDEDKR